MKPIVPSDATPVSKIKKYAGPSSHKEILRKIYDELKAEGKEVPPHYIHLVVVRFFSFHGIFQYVKEFKSFIIKNFGTFKRTRYNKPKDWMRNKATCMKKKKKKKKKHIIPAYKKHYDKYKRFNKTRIRKGLEPISLRDYTKINVLVHYFKQMQELEKKDLKS